MRPESAKKKRARAGRIIAELHRLYPEATCALDHLDAYQLLTATILSAQCTDLRVNLVTPALWEAFPGPTELADADLAELEGLIHSTGFFRNKAKNLKAMARAVVEGHGGQIPGTMEELVALPGVGRKTANVILGNWFGLPAIAVDTHVKRLRGRLELSAQEDPVKIEADLMKLAPKQEWTFLSHGLILHGRQVCSARKPACDRCTLRPDCPWPR